MCTRTRIVQFLVTAAQASSDRARPVQIDPTLDPDPRLASRASRPAPPARAFSVHVHMPVIFPGVCTRTRIVRFSQISTGKSSSDQTSPDRPDPTSGCGRSGGWRRLLAYAMREARPASGGLVKDLVRGARCD